MKKTGQHPFEILWTGLGYGLIATGLTLAVLDLVGQYLPVNDAQNWVLIAEQAVANFISIDWSWLLWGTIFLILGTIIAAFSNIFYAELYQVEADKAARRAQRLAEVLEEKK